MLFYKEEEGRRFMENIGQVVKYMENHYAKNYAFFKKALERIQSKELKDKLHNYYLHIVCNKCHFVYERVVMFTQIMANTFNYINTPEIEYYIEFVLEFYEDYFELFVRQVYLICQYTDFALINLCKNPLRYCGRKDREELLTNTFSFACVYDEQLMEEKDIVASLDAIIDIEKKHILSCYEKAKHHETYCEVCGPYCLVKNGKGLFKRTVPQRY